MNMNSVWGVRYVVLFLNIFLILSLSANAEHPISGFYKLRDIARDCTFTNVPEQSSTVWFPMYESGTSLYEGPDFEIEVDTQNQPFLKVKQYGSVLEIPLFVSHSRSEDAYYKNAQYNVESTQITFTSKGRGLSKCYSDPANSSIWYPCIKSWNDSWSMYLIDEPITRGQYLNVSWTRNGSSVYDNAKGKCTFKKD